MRRVNERPPAIARLASYAVPVLAAVVAAGIIATWSPDAVAVITQGAESAHEGVAKQFDHLDYAISDATAELEHVCRNGFVPKPSWRD